MESIHEQLVREGLIGLGQAARLLPRRFDGRTRDAKGLARWCRVGVRGVRLEHLRMPDGAYATSAQALARFLDRLKDPDPPPVTTPAADRAAHAAAVMYLESIGVK